MKRLNIKNAIKQKRLEILLNLFLCCKVQLLRIEMKYHFIHMAALASLTVPHSIRPTAVCPFSSIRGRIYSMASQMLAFKCSICLWLVGMTLFLNVAPQKIIQRCQITASGRSIDITNLSNQTAIKRLKQ